MNSPRGWNILLLPEALDTHQVPKPWHYRPSRPSSGEYQIDVSATSDQDTNFTLEVSAHYPELYGVWRLQWFAGGARYKYQYTSILLMKGSSGEMIITFFNLHTSRTDAVVQTMRLRSSSKGLVLRGYNPVYAGTQELSSDTISVIAALVMSGIVHN